MCIYIYMFVMVLLLFASEVCLVVGWRIVAAVAKEDHSSGAQSTKPPQTTPKYRSVPLRVGRAGSDLLCKKLALGPTLQRLLRSYSRGAACLATTLIRCAH